MKSMFSIYPLCSRAVGSLTLLPGTPQACQINLADSYRRQTIHFRLLITLILFLAANFGGALNTLHAQERGWNRWADPAENAFTMEVPQGWTARGGLFRFGYGDVRVMVDILSPDGKVHVRYGDVKFVEPYAIPDQYHREGEQQDLGSLGQGRYAAYRTGQQFAEIYAFRSFGGVCRSLSRQRTDSPSVRDTSVHRQHGGLVSTGEVTLRCGTPQGARIAYATATTTLTTSQPFSNAPPTTGWTPELASYLAPADQMSAAAGILRHFVGSFKLNPGWVQHQHEMDRRGTAYAIARAQGRLSQQQRQQQQQSASFTQGLNAQVGQFQAGQLRQQKQVDDFSLALNGYEKTNDPMHPTVEQGTHEGKWNCGMRGIIDSNLSPGGGCVRIR